MKDILKKITDPYLLFQIERVSSFHGYLSTGAFIGIQMLNIAKRVLDADPEEQLYITCETYNCLPDPFQILAGCTIGNKKLKIRDFGKMAVVANKRAPENQMLVRSVRIVLDPSKTSQYPGLHEWYMKTGKVPHEEAISLLIDAGESVYTYKFMDIELPEKPEKRIALCNKCGESFVQKKGGALCLACMENIGVLKE
ncbi:MAG: formylmethanofuran dehydrogenase [Candidatus Methanoperedens sp.]|nr:formylmethanofuran dehydrogenase [Candidatus Methanoperedens sp.]MCE8428104.1 formylmethanofuran dehydrogenase [Candidatus Methanoperedens sp.]